MLTGTQWWIVLIVGIIAAIICGAFLYSYDVPIVQNVAISAVFGVGAGFVVIAPTKTPQEP